MSGPHKSAPRIVVVGSLVYDFVATADRLPCKGETVLGTSFGMFSGGKGANQAVQAGRLGGEVYMIGRVGDDFMADRVLSSLQKANVRTDFVRRDATVSTAACCIHVDAHGDNAIIIVPEANMACVPADVDAARDIIESADVLLCQLETALPAVAHAITLACDAGVPIVLNPAPLQEVPDGLFAKATLLTPNETEAEFFAKVAIAAEAANSDEPLRWESAVADNLLAMGPPTVVITLGDRGAYLASRQHRQLVPGYRVKAVDVTAAGDAFNGALAVALAEGQGIETAVLFANAAGAVAATRPGAQPSLATRTEIEKFLQGQE